MTDSKEWFRYEQLFVTSVLLFVGMGEFISSIFVLVDSGNYYLGGVYLGALCMVVGAAGYFDPFNRTNFWQGLLLLVTLCSVVSTILQGISFGDVNDLKACSVYTPNVLTGSCISFGYYECKGDRTYFTDALSCATSYDNGINDNVCGCVKSVHPSSDCFMFRNMDECDKLLVDLPQSLLASLVLSCFLAAVSTVSFSYRTMTVAPLSRLFSPSDASTYRDNSPAFYRANDRQGMLVNVEEEEGAGGVGGFGGGHEVVFPDTPSENVVGDRARRKTKPFTELAI